MTYVGNDAANRLEGGAGNDSFLTGRGGDTIIGGAGLDTVSYADSNGTVQVNLTLGRGFNNYADSDTYDSIENVVGSNFNDILIGDAGVNRLDGGGGDDMLIGALGADVLIGGAGRTPRATRIRSGRCSSICRSARDSTTRPRATPIQYRECPRLALRRLSDRR